ncbi:conserved hypothetical protein [Chloroherpeton thalassium ATCC 35110]|uniref:Uncharacterized protein n=1 Tax=Chloroherpeton thalassium (strain ATCC 35110 / GB-78) TaxID=517418 RepID=B3QXC5_CHLT3|nr:hypothetical protein [Chloroherpeton thalassium]ACF13399.1 conserved hypothetical protein [Chloroherpeton thalassium ATCC 35110]
MPEHKKETLAISEKCMIQKCSCGAIHLHYQYVSLAIQKDTLFNIMQKCYTWQERLKDESFFAQQTPFKILIGVCMLTVSSDDFPRFNATVQEATSKLMCLEKVLNTSKIALN